ncbi:hypothetical protein AB0F36_07740 [Streptomyces sp. NPDC029080]|uniref:hypothetical protein n=1 Tax=Streptomyces sp. NPDC029080 TaxID=3155017 RepID=UPI0033F659A0
MTDLNWDHINDIAAKVAKEMALKWPVVEAEDVQQEILVHMVEQANYIAKRQDDEEFLRKVAWRVAKQYASKEQNQRDLMDDQYYYTPDEARAVLRSLGLHTDEEISGLIGKKDDLTKTRISDNISSARIDAEAALKKMTDRYRAVLMKVFVYGLPPKDDAERKMSYRAVDALAIAMNSHLRTGKVAA